MTSAGFSPTQFFTMRAFLKRYDIGAGIDSRMGWRSGLEVNLSPAMACSAKRRHAETASNCGKRNYQEAKTALPGPLH